MKFAGQGVSLARKYHHARIRSDETPLEYLYRLNVAAIRAKISIREGTLDVRREHVEHFIETLDDRVLAKQLALLRLTDVDDMEEALHAYDRTETRSSKATMGSSKFRPRSGFTSDPSPSKPTRAVRAIRVEESGSSGSDAESSESELDADRRRVCITAAQGQLHFSKDRRDRQASDDPGDGQDRNDRSHGRDHYGRHRGLEGGERSPGPDRNDRSRSER